jgi:polyferredoxin
MKFQTRLTKLIQNSLGLLKRKLGFLKTNFSLSLFSLFLGFLSGNLFGTFLTSLRTFLPWDGWIVCSLLFCFEVISYQVYHSKNRSFLVLWKFPGITVTQSPGTQNQSTGPTTFWRHLNYVKIGLLLGFFVDAFKVGS